MMTKLQIQEAITTNLLSDTDFFTPAQLDWAILRAYRRLAEASLQYEETNIQTTVGGQYIYATPPDCIMVKEVFYDNNRLNPESLDTISDYYATGVTPGTIFGYPTQWAKYNLNQIWLYATPPEGKDLKIIYAAYAPDLVLDTDISIFPAEGDNYMINFVTAQKWLLDNEMEKYYAYKKEYQENLDYVKRLTTPVPASTPLDRSFEYPAPSVWRG